MPLPTNVSVLLLLPLPLLGSQQAPGGWRRTRQSEGCRWMASPLNRWRRLS